VGASAHRQELRQQWWAPVQDLLGKLGIVATALPAAGP